MSSAYENVVGGKLKLKGKALDVKAASGIKKKKNKKNKQLENNKKNHQLNEHFDDEHETTAAAKDNDLLSTGGSAEVLSDPSQEEEVGDASKSAGENVARWDDHLTPAERRYVEQRAEIDMHRLAKTANKSHRDRIQDFNQYLANMSEHYDIPKVGPGAILLETLVRMRFWPAGALRAASMAKRGAAGVISPPPSTAWSYHAGMKGHVSIGSWRPGLKSIGLSNRIEYPWSGVEKGIVLHQINAPKSISERKFKKVFVYVTQNKKKVFLHLYNMFFGALTLNGVKFWTWDFPNKEKQDVASAATATRLINLKDQLTEVKAMGTKNLEKLEEKLGLVLAGQAISAAVIGFIVWFTAKP